MKWNKIILKILHFFGIAKDVAHFDDVKMFLDLEKMEHIHYNFKETSYIRNENFTIELVDKLRAEVYKEFEDNYKLEKTCRKVHQVWVVFPGGMCKMFRYIYSVLYWPALEYEESDIAYQKWCKETGKTYIKPEHGLD